MNQLALVENSTNCKSHSFGVKFVIATCLDRMLELRYKNILSIDRALTRKVTEHYFKEVVAASLLISSGTSVYFRDEIFNRAPINRLQLSIVTDENFT